MLNQIKTFEGNVLALELTETFTEADAQSIKQLFEEKLANGAAHVNLLIKVKDMSVMKHMDWRAFVDGEVWGFKHFGKIGRCAVVAHSDFIKAAVKIESKVLHLANSAFEERYFDTDQLDEAMAFISAA
ncbi:SpoIIAA family protein [Taibaiella soli]|uniref:STAS/SEC14 domain-containing protein n=1 Tax=Taibaiella soli TaxID=1649169 RepID=A0A2W2AXP1_9BACT|nr:STAS/SEC14 domain-containing protein [Taibaiella soli]PZF72764.1 STAS/SEC14 domain-containing protein [Taibaiella soli]